MLRELFEGAGVASALDHTRIEAANDPEALQRDAAAARVARRAADALRRSRAACEVRDGLRGTAAPGAIVQQSSAALCLLAHAVADAFGRVRGARRMSDPTRKRRARPRPSTCPRCTTRRAAARAPAAAWCTRAGACLSALAAGAGGQCSTLWGRSAPCAGSGREQTLVLAGATQHGSTAVSALFQI